MNQSANDFIVIRLRRYSIPLLFGYAVIHSLCSCYSHFVRYSCFARNYH